MCSETRPAGADLLKRVQLYGVRDDLRGNRHASCPQLHLLRLLPVVQSSTAHPTETHTILKCAFKVDHISPFVSGFLFVKLTLLRSADRLTHLVITLQKSGT